MKGLYILRLLKCIYFVIVVLIPINAKADCQLRDYVYESGVYKLSFKKGDELDETQRPQSATRYYFEIINTKEGLSFPGVLAYGNGDSYPQVNINLCSHKNHEFKKSIQSGAIM